MDRCALCPGTYTCVRPDGPRRKGGILFVGEAPGVQENKACRPFVGKTGEEVNQHYLPLAALRRQDVTFTNAIACLPDTPQHKLDPDQPKHLALMEMCAAHHLYPLIEEMQPSLIVPLGNFACRAIFGEPFDLELKHGIPTESPWGPTFPMFHPALGMYEPKKMLYLRTDWDRLRKYLKGALVLPVDAYEGWEDYAEVTDVREIADIDPTIPLGGDTETSPEVGTYCLTYSQYPGTGRLILSERRDLVQAFQAKVERWESIILFHNWLYDWGEVEEMGITFPTKKVVDTMQIIYLLGNLPQGLKDIAFRVLGMSMQSFVDLVRPHSTQRALAYLEQGLAHDWPKPDPSMVLDEKGKWKPYRPQGMGTKFKRLFTDYKKNPNLDLFERWKNWEAHHEEIESVLGPWPGMDIRHAPFDEVIHYACRDADAVIRLWPILKKMLRMTRRYPQERWLERAA